MGLGDLFGGGETSVDNSGAYAQYAQAMRDRMPAYDSWINRGNWAGDTQKSQADWLLNDPNALQDKIAAGYEESPYSRYLQDMVTKRMNYNAANTGMLGSGAAQRALQQELVGMNGKFLNDYINRGMGSYNLGFGSLNPMQTLGYGALESQTNLYDQAAAGDLMGTMSRNQYDAMNSGNSWLGPVLGIAGAAIGGMTGGVPGAQAGYRIGSAVGGSGQGGGAGGGSSWLGKMFGGGGQGVGGRGVNSGMGLNAAWTPNSMGGYTQTYGQPGVGMPTTGSWSY